MLGGENYEEESALFDGKDSEYGGRSFCGFTMRRQIIRVKSARNVTQVTKVTNVNGHVC